MNDTETVPIGGAYTIDIPTSWEEIQNPGNGYFLESDNSEIRIRFYSLTGQVRFGIDDLESLMDVLAVGVFGEESVDTSAIQEVEFADREGISYTYEENFEGRSYTRTMQAFIYDNGFIVGGYIRPIEGADLNADDVEAVRMAMSTFDLQDNLSFV